MFTESFVEHLKLFELGVRGRVRGGGGGKKNFRFCLNVCIYAKSKLYIKLNLNFADLDKNKNTEVTLKTVADWLYGQQES